MTTRPDPLAFVRAAALAVLETAHAYPTVQDGTTFPSIVYYGVSNIGLTTFGVTADRATAVRIEVRAQQFAKTVELEQKIVRRLREGGRLRALLALIDEYDDDLNVYHRTRTVMIKQ